MPTPSQFIEFQEKIGDLQQLRRTGWVMRRVPSPETVADHSWRMAVMAIQKENELLQVGVHVNHLVEMCLLHDVGESVIGDIVPEEHQTGAHKISDTEKKQIETDAVSALAEKYDFPKLKIMFDEYEAQKTIEARVAKNLDKLDMLLQAYEYVNRFPKADTLGLNLFMPNNEKGVNLPIFAADLQEIKNRQFADKHTPNAFIDFQLLAGKIKHLPHELSPMVDSDTISMAAHSFRTALMVLHLGKEPEIYQLNIQHILRAILLHPMKKATDTATFHQEKAFIHQLSTQFNMPYLKTYYEAMEQNLTPESITAQAFEIIENIQHLYEYTLKYPHSGLLNDYILTHQLQLNTHFASSLMDIYQKKAV